MNTEKKVFLIISLINVVLFGVLFIISQTVLLDGFKTIEKSDVKNNVERALDALNGKIEQLKSATFDYATWDDTYSYVQVPDEEYIKLNYIPDVFTKKEWNFVILFDNSKEIIYSNGFNLETKTNNPISAETIKVLKDLPIFKFKDTKDNIFSFVLLPDGPAYIASLPIVTSIQEGPIRGTIVAGHYINDTSINQLSKMTHVTVSLFNMKETKLPDEILTVKEELYNSKNQSNLKIIKEISTNDICGYSLINDIENNPILILKVEKHRDIYNQGKDSISFFLILFLIISIIFSVFIIYLLRRAAKKLKSEERIQKEMELAKRIQTSLLPEIPFSEHYQISADMIPAEDVGGDYYDLLIGPDGRHWYGIGDVTGHGLTSGLIMMMAQTAVLTSLKLNLQIEPKEVLINVNSVLYENIRKRLGTDHYMTFSLLSSSIDGKFDYVGAHQDIVIYRNSHKKCERINTTGIWLGILPEISKDIHTSSFILEPGDVLLLFTDGLIEAKNINNHQFDMERLINSFEKHINSPINEIKKNILNDVNDFMETQADDITIMLVKKK